MTTTTTRRRATSGPITDRRRPPRHVGRVIAWLTAVALLAAAGIVWLTPVLGLRTITVVGSNSAALTADIRAAVGIAPDTPLVRIDIDAVTDRVGKVGPVKTATVTRDWPHGLIVTVTRRTAVATTQANGQWWLVDATGKPYESVPDKPDGLMPLRLATPGEGDRATLAALAVLHSLPASIRDDVRSMSAPTAYDVSLLLDDGRTVIWGDASHAAEKAAVLPAVLTRHGTTFDITDPTLVTVR